MGSPKSKIGKKKLKALTPKNIFRWGTTGPELAPWAPQRGKLRAVGPGQGGRPKRPVQEFT